VPFAKIPPFAERKHPPDQKSGPSVEGDQFGAELVDIFVLDGIGENAVDFSSAREVEAEEGVLKLLELRCLEARGRMRSTQAAASGERVRGKRLG